jgi:signal peptidase II
LLIALVVVAADVLTKTIVVSTMDLHEVRRVFGDYVRLTYILNPGAAFGLFPGSRIALVAVSVAAVVVVLVSAWNPRTRFGTYFPLGLILGGAIGNLIDRVRLGMVVDFIQVGIPPRYYWPVFNVADSAVTIGVAWIALALALRSQERAPEPSLSAGEKPVAVVAPSRDDG